MRSSLVLVVTYNGAESICATLKDCLAGSIQKPSILLFDNASQDGTVTKVKSLHIKKLDIFQSENNIGVGGAYNFALKYCMEYGIKWLFILDQDSSFTCGSLDNLFQTARFFQKSGEKIGAVAPMVLNRYFPEIIHYPYTWNGKRFLPQIQEGNHHLIDSTISSGTLYSVDALVSVEGFQEKYFIDFIDHDCNLRLREAGYTIRWEKDAVLYHKLGKIQKMTPEGLWIEHDPFRYYYMTRNMIHGYWHLGKWGAIFNFSADLVRHSKRLLKYGIQPKKSFYYMVLGIFDGLRKRFGPLDTRL